MFTDKAQAAIDLAKDHVCGTSGPAGQLTIAALLAAMAHRAETATLLAECLGVTREGIRDVCPELVTTMRCRGKLDLSEGMRAVVLSARGLANDVVDRSHPGLVDVRHLTGAIALSREACDQCAVPVKSISEVVQVLTTWYDRDLSVPRLDELAARLETLRKDLLKRVFGQDHAVHAFVEGLFNAEVVTSADTARTAPRAVFVFAGPPGVGKTFMAELGAAHLQRPFKRFDMSGFSGHQQGEALTGMARSFMGAHPGILTEFVEKNPTAVLLFDEIEKAHRNTIHLFLQLLDRGALEDKYHERNVPFGETTIIFTTNAGRMLYERPNATGVHTLNTTFHRRTILDALETERDPLTREPFFPQALCSRLATGYPVLFHHLGCAELERVAAAELARVGALIEKQYAKDVRVDSQVALCLVLREGAHADARTVRSQTEGFVKGELFKFCQLFDSDRLEDVLERVDSIEFSFDDRQSRPAELQELFDVTGAPRVLLVAGADLGDLYARAYGDISWLTAATPEDALRLLATQPVDLVLLDLWLGQKSSTETIEQFDRLPTGARGLDRGQELLRKVRERMPETPLFILALPSTRTPSMPPWTTSCS
jgi:ATP-dependent Clp protease ATP-binding subunit ClpA/CheY-like chemotaxis protein